MEIEDIGVVFRDFFRRKKPENKETSQNGLITPGIAQAKNCSNIYNFGLKKKGEVFGINNILGTESTT